MRTALQQEKEGFWRVTWRHFRRNPLGMAGLSVILFLVVIALGAPVLANDIPLIMKHNERTYVLPAVITYSPLLSEGLYNNFRAWEPGEGEYGVRPIVPFSPRNQFIRERNEGPSARHWLGTDDRGRSVLSRMIWGTRVSLSIGIIAVGISLIIGIPMGAIAGYYGGWVDSIILRIIEIMMSVPTFFLLLACIAFLPQSIYTIMAVIGLLSWMGIARLVRGEFIRLRDSEFVVAARAAGFGAPRVIFRHVLPNALSPVFVSATFGVAGAILMESGLSFLGFGAPPPTATWGELLQQSQRLIGTGVWWLVVFPGAAVFVTVTAFNLVGDALRDAMDPRFRG